MRIKKNLLKPAVLLAAVCLFIAFSGTAEAARLLALTAPPTGDPGTETSKIVLIDTATGTSTVLADTGLVRSTDPDAPNGMAGPNGLAYDPGTGTAYFSSRPGNPPGPGNEPPILYSVVVDQLSGAPPPGPIVPLGNPTPADRGLADAAFFDGKYWYIDHGTDDLRCISFNPGGSISADVKVADLLSNSAVLFFGDIGIKDGILHGSAEKVGAVGPFPVVFFTVDLNPASGVFLDYVEHLAGAPTLDPPFGPVLQLGFGDDGTLFGVTGAFVGNDLYYIRLLPGQLGLRGLALEGFPGGPFTDMAQWNPICDCPREGEPGCEEGDDDDGVCEEDDDDD